MLSAGWVSTAFPGPLSREGRGRQSLFPLPRWQTHDAPPDLEGLRLGGAAPSVGCTPRPLTFRCRAAAPFPPAGAFAPCPPFPLAALRPNRKSIKAGGKGAFIGPGCARWACRRRNQRLARRGIGVCPCPPPGVSLGAARSGRRLALDPRIAFCAVRPGGRPGCAVGALSRFPRLRASFAPRCAKPRPLLVLGAASPGVRLPARAAFVRPWLRVPWRASALAGAGPLPGLASPARPSARCALLASAVGGPPVRRSLRCGPSSLAGRSRCLLARPLGFRFWGSVGLRAAVPLFLPGLRLPGCVAWLPVAYPGRSSGKQGKKTVSGGTGCKMPGRGWAILARLRRGHPGGRPALGKARPPAGLRLFSEVLQKYYS